jgi:hypothetical protein
MVELTIQIRTLPEDRLLREAMVKECIKGGWASPKNASPARTDDRWVAEGADNKLGGRAAMPFANALRSRRGDRSTYLLTVADAVLGAASASL